jgi:hypothetical protein
MEDMQPQASMKVVHNNINPGTDIEEEAQGLEQEQASLEQEQENVPGENQEEIVVTKEVLVFRMEEIRVRLIKIEEEKKKKKSIITKFLQIYEETQKADISILKIASIIFEKEEFKALPREVMEEVKTNYEKYSFIDYKLVEESLKQDEFSEELESLHTEQERGQERITMFESQEQEVAESEPENESLSLENEVAEEASILDDLEGIMGEESSIELGSDMEEAPFGGNPFEAIKGGGSENLAEGLGDVGSNVAEGLGDSAGNVAEGLGNVTEGAGQAMEAVGEGVGAAVDGLSQAA